MDHAVVLIISFYVGCVALVAKRCVDLELALVSRGVGKSLPQNARGDL